MNQNQSKDHIKSGNGEACTECGEVHNQRTAEEILAVSLELSNFFAYLGFDPVDAIGVCAMFCAQIAATSRDVSVMSEAFIDMFKKSTAAFSEIVEMKRKEIKR